MSNKKNGETRGRKPHKTPSGERIRKVVCNITVPSNLYDWMVDNNIARSKMFVDVLKLVKAGEFCPLCFKQDRSEDEYGIYCPHCSNYPYRVQYVFGIKSCDQCGVQATLNSQGKLRFSCNCGD